MRFYLVDFKVLLFKEKCSATFDFKLEKYWIGKDTLIWNNQIYYNFIDFLNEIKNIIKFEIITNEELDKLQYPDDKGFISKYNPYFEINDDELFYLTLKYEKVFNELYTGSKRPIQ